MKNNSVIILDKNQTIDINESINLNIIDLKSNNLNSTTTINIHKDISLNLNIISLNNKANKKELKFILNLNANNSLVSIKSNSLLLDNSSTKVELTAYSNLNKNNSNIDIQINGILDGKNTSFTGIPIFKFNSSNEIIAKHSLNIGAINGNELLYLINRGLDTKVAKYMLISSKIFGFLNNLKNDEKKIYENKILEMWGKRNAEY